MIPPKIQSLFDFIDFLDQHKERFITEYLPRCEELQLVLNQRAKLQPSKNYSDKIKNDELQKEIEVKFKPIEENVLVPITQKLLELNVWSGDPNYSSIWNSNASAILDYTRDFETGDLPIVFSYKKKYISFRSETNSNFMSLGLVFHSLDEILKLLFEFFKNSDVNEFEMFESKVVAVSSVQEIAQQLSFNGSGANLAFSIPFEATSTKNERGNGKTTIKMKNKIHTGDKIHVGDVSGNRGSFSVNDKSVIANQPDSLSLKTFNWQKWGTIIGIFLALASLIAAIILS